MQTEQHRAQSRSHPGLEIQEDVAFARTEWKIQRGGWLVLGLITLAALLGLFGHGLLSSASVADGRLHLQYQRFERFQRPTKMELRVSGAVGESTSVVLDRSYLKAIRIEQIMPQPEKVEANARGLIYHFAGKGDPITVTFHFQLEQFGSLNGQVGLANGPMLSFNQFVYP
jgi:hypothetical protein